MESIIKFVAVATTLLCWAILGMYMAIPAIIVAMLCYIAGIVTSAVTEEKELQEYAEKFLSISIWFYPNGFLKILNAVYTKKTKPNNGKSEPDLFSTIFGLIVLGGILVVLATLVWWLFFWVIRYIGVTTLCGLIANFWNVSHCTA